MRLKLEFDILKCFLCELLTSPTGIFSTQRECNGSDISARHGENLLN